VDSSTILITHLLDIIKSNAHELLGRQEVKTIIDAARENYSAVASTVPIRVLIALIPAPAN
ncbi:FHIPEP family type III secretion protein, partial [Clostridioides difficile]